MKPQDLPLPYDWNLHIKRGVLAVVALAHTATVELYRRGHETIHPLYRHHVRLQRAESDAHLLRAQIRLVSARARRANRKERPARRGLGYYTDTERFEILNIQMARGWSHARTAREFLVCDRTIAWWHRESEDDSLVKGPRSPVNKFPDYVRLVVLTLKRTFPHLGHRKIAEFLARAGLVLAATTVRRLLARPKNTHRPLIRSRLPRKKPDSTQLVARYPGHIWHADITSIPTNLSTLFSWWPTCFPRVFPKTRSVVAVLDSFTRQVVAIRCFGAGVSAAQVIQTLDEAVTVFGSAPKHLTNDKGSQFFNSKTVKPARLLKAWLENNNIQVRFGAVGKKGSIAIIERFFLTLKDEGTRKAPIPLGRSEVDTELSVFAEWYNTKRPHASLGGRTPEEARLGTPLPAERPRFETRPGYPVAAADIAAGRVWRVDHIRLNPRCFKRRGHLPDVSLDVAA